MQILIYLDRLKHVFVRCGPHRVSFLSCAGAQTETSVCERTEAITSEPAFSTAEPCY